MNCDCKECSRLRRWWSWLDGDPGPAGSFLTFGCLAGLFFAWCRWGWP